MQHNSLHSKQVSSQDFGGKDTKGSINWCEGRGDPFLHLWFSSLYLFIQVEKRSKLDPSNKKCLFVGYNECLKAYKIYISRERKTTAGKDVKS